MTTPAQERLRDELLGWGRPRPPADLEIAPVLKQAIEDGVSPVVDLVPDGDRLFVSKSRLDALACDGRFLDQLDDTFAWNVNVARGKLAHKALELDWRSARGHPPDDVVAHAWSQLVQEDESLGGYLADLAGIEADQLRTDAEYLLSDFRDTWPTLPAFTSPRLELRMGATFGARRVAVSGTPDLLLGRANRDDLRMLLVDFKTGMRKPAVERQEMRFYALLATLKYGVPPFRWATYYVAEGAWESEDYAPELLHGAARRLVDGVLRIGRLELNRPTEEHLRLVAGAYCNWCSREPTCDTAAAAR